MATLRATVADNHSTDEGVDGLRAAAADLDASFELARWPASTATTNTHGDVLRDFVLARPQADYFLFLDADIVFLADGTVATMPTNSEHRPTCGPYRPGTCHPSDALRRAASTSARAMPKCSTPASRNSVALHCPRERTGRVHPGCALIANSDPLRLATERLGFGTFVRLAQDNSLAGFYDTMAVVSAVMTTHRLRYELSAVSVVHYFNVSYVDRTALTTRASRC